MCLIALSSAAYSSAQALERFVATDGNDNAGTNNCSDPNNPCLTVANAVQNSQTGDHVRIAAGTYTEVEIIISGVDLKITGDSAKTTIIDGQNNNRLFWVLLDASVEISQVTVQNGEPGGGSQDEGGAIKNEGFLKLSHCVLRDNGSQNQTASHGGALFNGRRPPETQGGVAEISHCTLSGNSSLVRGGGISNGGGEPDDYVGTMTIVNRTIVENTSGLASASQLGGGGGGLFNHQGSTLNLFNVTIADNVANPTDNGDNGGGGLHNRTGGTATINNTLIANNEDSSSLLAEDCFGNLDSTFGHNLVEVITGCTLAGNTTGNLTGTDPLLDVLADNGGDTPTQALFSGSPAIDAGDPTGCKDDGGLTLSTDQRGEPRPEAGIAGSAPLCDIGAYEAPAGTTPNLNTGTGSVGSGGCSIGQASLGHGTVLVQWLLGLGSLLFWGYLRRRS